MMLLVKPSKLHEVGPIELAVLAVEYAVPLAKSTFVSSLHKVTVSYSEVLRRWQRLVSDNSCLSPTIGYCAPLSMVIHSASDPVIRSSSPGAAAMIGKYNDIPGRRTSKRRI